MINMSLLFFTIAACHVQRGVLSLSVPLISASTASKISSHPPGCVAHEHRRKTSLLQQQRNNNIPLTALQEKQADDDLFWPSSPAHSENNINDGDNCDDLEEEVNLLASALDSVVKVYVTHSEPDFLIPWQRQHQTTSTSSGFVLDVPGVGLRVMTNAHSVEYGSVVQVQRRGEDEKHAATVEAVGNECDLALLRVDSLLPTQNGDDDDCDTSQFAMSLGPLPVLQDEVEVLGYPAGGDSLCVTKGVVSRLEVQEYAQAGERLLAMQIDAAINPGVSENIYIMLHIFVCSPFLFMGHCKEFWWTSCK